MSSAALFRMTLTPIDTLKTTLQVQGARGTALLRQRIKTNGVGSLWWGAFATAAATFVGHYPWFATVSYSCINQYQLLAHKSTVQFPLRHHHRAIKVRSRLVATPPSVHRLRRVDCVRLDFQLASSFEDVPTG